MIFDRWVKDKLENKFWAYLQRQTDIPHKHKEKIFNITIKVLKTGFIIGNIGIALFMIYFFNKIVLNNFGFERTIISLAVLLVMKEWFK